MCAGCDQLPNRPGRKVLIILDELNSADKMVMRHQLVLDRKLGDYELPKGCRNVAAGNRVADLRGQSNPGTASQSLRAGRACAER